MQSVYSEYIHKSRYARYLDDKKRRETWEETVGRYIENVVKPVLAKCHGKDSYPFSVEESVYNAIVNQDVMPSMRGLMTAGKALDRDHVALYNCSYLPVDHPRAFDEAMYILLCGTGVGFSVERQFTNKLPEVSEEFYPTTTTIRVQDSKIGWAKAFKELVSMLYSGNLPDWDVSAVRPSGARLKTFGGRASGPEPLERLFKFTVDTFKRAKGRRLSSIECHDLMCKIGETVVVGGVRRSAMISLSNMSDDRMRHAKSGQWWETAPHRSLSNNSICYTEKPDFESFLREWTSLYESKSGERGMFNRVAAKKQCEKIGRDPEHEWGTNPCSEIILRPYQFCNLTEVVVRSEDTLETLKDKVAIATLLGTIQSTYTDFRYLRAVWKKNTEEERLLGVSMTGVMDHPILSKVTNESKQWFSELRQHARIHNCSWADSFGIPHSAAITCVKPSGTVSQLVDAASGLHPRYSRYYTRRVRNDSKDPLTPFLKASGVPCEDDVMTSGQVVFSFPQKAPDTAVLRNDMSAIEQLEHWKMMQEHWCEHKPSITVYYRDSEFLQVGHWVWEHFNMLSGVSFLPHSEHTYQQAPYEEITEEQYVAALVGFPTTIDWGSVEEQTDNTTGTQTLACTGNSCEIS